MRNARKRRLKRSSIIPKAKRTWATIKASKPHHCGVCGTGFADFDQAFKCEQRHNARKDM